MADCDVGKLFVGGVSRDTSDAMLKDYFSKYGDVSSSIIAKDRLTGTPRGFGFVTFSDPSSVERALLDHHLIDNRTVEVKKAIPRSEQQQSIPKQQQSHQQQQQQLPSPIHSQTSKGLGRNTNGSFGASNSNQHLRAKKIFVGGLSANLTEEEFKSYFEKFGRITDVVVMHDNNTNRPRGFGFITFDSEEVVEMILQKTDHELAGKRVEVKKAIPREATKFYNNGNNSRPDGGRFSPGACYVAEDNYWPRGPYGSYGQFPFPSAYPGFYYCGGVYSGGYPVAGGYGVLGYGTHLVPPRSPWNGFGMIPAPPVNYGTGFYPSGVNGGIPVLGMVNPYNSFMEPGANGKSDHSFGGNTQMPAKDATALMNGARSDVDASSLKMGKGAANVRKNSRTPDTQAQTKVPPTDQSS